MLLLQCFLFSFKNVLSSLFHESPPATSSGGPGTVPLGPITGITAGLSFLSLGLPLSHTVSQRKSETDGLAFGGVALVGLPSLKTNVFAFHPPSALTPLVISSHCFGGRLKVHHSLNIFFMVAFN